MSKKRILILSASYGHGHKAVGQAIKSALDRRADPDVKIELVDIADELRHYTNHAFTKTYERATRYTPSFYGFFYRATDNPYSQKMMQLLIVSVNYRRLKKFIRQQNPDVIVSVFPVWHHMIKSVIKPAEKTFSFVNVLTDSLSIHSAWIGDFVDYYVVSDKNTAEVVQLLGANKKAIRTLGYPVGLEFTKLPSNQTARSKLGLDKRKNIILYIASGDHFFQASKIIKHLSSLDAKVIVICGRNKRLYKPLRLIYGNGENISIVGWSDQMPVFIAASDLVVTKAGGSTVMECLAAKRPIIINRVTPEIEEGNARLVTNNKLGFVESKPKKIAQQADYILANKQAFSDRLRAFEIDPQAAHRVADFIARLCD